LANYLITLLHSTRDMLVDFFRWCKVVCLLISLQCNPITTKLPFLYDFPTSQIQCTIPCARSPGWRSNNVFTGSCNIELKTSRQKESVDSLCVSCRQSSLSSAVQHVCRTCRQALFGINSIYIRHCQGGSLGSRLPTECKGSILSRS
jgi:hypothetical protein